MKHKHQLGLVIILIIALGIVIVPWISGAYLHFFTYRYLKRFNEHHKLVKLELNEYDQHWLYANGQFKLSLNHEQTDSLTKDIELATITFDVFHGPLIDYVSPEQKTRWHWGWGMTVARLDPVDGLLADRSMKLEGLVPFFSNFELNIYHPGSDKKADPAQVSVDHLNGKIKYESDYIMESAQLTFQRIQQKRQDFDWRVKNGRAYYKITHKNWHPDWVAWQGGRIGQLDILNSGNKVLTCDNLHWLGRFWVYHGLFDFENQWQAKRLNIAGHDFNKLNLAMELSRIHINRIEQWVNNLWEQSDQGDKQSYEQFVQLWRDGEFVVKAWLLNNDAKAKLELDFPKTIESEDISKQSLIMSWLKAGRMHFHMKLPKQWAHNLLQKAGVKVPETEPKPPKEPGHFPELTSRHLLADWIRWGIRNHYLRLYHGAYETDIKYDGSRWFIRGRTFDQ